MNKDLHKRLDEAAKEYADKRFPRHRASENDRRAREDYQLCRDTYKAGAEQGYKEAIEQAKEWLHNNLHLYIMSGSRQINYTFLMDGLEKAMSELWEEKK